MIPRLKQPLFETLEQSKLKTQFASDYTAANLIRLYDVLWNVMHCPVDMVPTAIEDNAVNMLHSLGSYLELKCGESAFDVEEPSSQLEFDFDNSGIEPE